jgi:flavin reductase (DIM6/NTAB) family NADH-FMN oxidoreductase RutF
MHKTIEPALLYVGTPVALISTSNEDGSTNVAPMSSVWLLGWTAMLGLDASSKTPQNMQRTAECVLNFPSADLVGHVDRLALLTGTSSLPPHKRWLGYRCEPDKAGVAGLSLVASEKVAPPRVKECPIQLEAIVHCIRPVAENDPHMAVPMIAAEVRVVRVHVEDSVLADGEAHRIDPERWRPLIMSFRQFFGLGPVLHSSRLGRAPESHYAPPKRAAAATLR